MICGQMTAAAYLGSHSRLNQSPGFWLRRIHSSPRGSAPDACFVSDQKAATQQEHLSAKSTHVRIGLAMIRAVFMGTPEFAVPVLTALADAFQVVGIVTQPDRPFGRRRRLMTPPIKKVAETRQLPTCQPESLRAPEALAQLAAWEPDVIAVAAFGQMLDQEVLDLPTYGCLNVHLSLLPRWRGAAPVAAAILAGDTVTGVTIMRMDAGLDTGPILTQRQERIDPTDTRSKLSERLARVGAALLVETIRGVVAGEIAPRPQPEDGVSYARRLSKVDGQLDWSRAAEDLSRHVRAFTPWPGAYTWWGEQRLAILSATPMPEWIGDAPPGTVFDLVDGAAVATGEGALCLGEVQLAGRRRMGAQAFLCGQRDCVGSQLGATEST